MRVVNILAICGAIVITVQGQSLIDPASQIGKGVITGTIKTKSGKPVVGEPIRIIQLDSQGRRKPPAEQMTLKIHLSRISPRTDDRGVYRAWHLPSGRYLVAIGRAGNELLIGERKRYFRQTFYPGVTREEEAKVIVLSDGEEAQNIDIILSDEMSTYSISGTVIDDTTKRPVNDVMVGYQYQGQSNQSLVAGSRTNINGQFRIDGITPGTYDLFAPDGVNTYASVSPTSFTVQDKDVTGLQIRVVNTIKFQGKVLIEGVAQSDIGDGFSRLGLYLARSPAAGRRPDFTPILINPDGSFQTNILPGEYRLGASLSAPGGPKLQRVEINGSPYNGQFTLVPTTQSYQARIIFSLKTGQVRGQVISPPGIRGSIRVVITGVSLSALPATVAPDGSFQFEHIPAGECEVAAYLVVSGKIAARGKQKVFVYHDNVTTTTVTLNEIR